MHELSIAQNIVDIVHENVPEEELNQVKSIKVKIGEMAGIVAESLEFCFIAITSDTPLSNSKLQIEKVPFMLYCNNCNTETSNDIGIRMCSNCGSYDTTIKSGTEMNVTEVEL